jgi:hypothetical protein
MTFNVNPGVQNHAGEYIAQGIREFFGQMAERRRREREDSRLDRARSDQRTMIEAQNPGLHLTDRGVFDIPQSVWDTTARSVSDAVDRGGTASPAPARGISPLSDRSDFQSLLSQALGDKTPTGPRYEFGKGFYRDNAETDAAAQRSQARSGNAEFQKVLMHVLENQLTPKPQQHIVDPTSGDVTFYDPTKPPLGLKVTPTPKAPVMGSPEWKSAERFVASLKPDDRTLVPVQQPDGSVIYAPRSQAAGLKAPQAAPKAASIAAPMAAKVGQAGEMIKKASDLLPTMETLNVSLEESAAQDQATHGVGALGIHIPGTQGIGSAMVNRTPEYAKYQAALTPFVLAAAHAIGGARISDIQISQIRNSVEIKPGDSKTVRAQKFKNLTDLVNSIAGSLPPDAIAAQEKQMDPNAMTLLRGYGYRGGKDTSSPATQSSRGDINLGTPEKHGATPTGSKEQQLWDAAVALHGRAKVEAEYGPRPQ